MPPKKDVQRSRYQQEAERFLGKTKQQVLDIAGEPAKRKGTVWIYKEALGPGAHSFQWYTYLHFKDGTVVRVAVESRAIGCVIKEF
ncbi:hypothetical protein GF342_04265 [Candidatus Woesearchaeota archaeon]|nr:hypothetical protein [Candidatus Woesearchaeota archaeon]